MQLTPGTHRFVLALLLAGGGLLLAGRSLWPRLFHANPEPVFAPDTEVELALGPDLLDTETDLPKEELAALASRQLREALGESSQSTLNAKQVEDLVAAFLERLLATTAGEYQRDIDAKVARGMQRPPPSSSSDPPARWVAATDWTRGARIGLNRIEIRTILSRGKAIAPLPNEEGYESTTYTKKGATAFPLPGDPVASQSHVVEVRLPMGVRPVRGTSRGTVLVGYQFLWSPSRQQWVPFTNVIYKASGETYAALPF